MKSFLSLFAVCIVGAASVYSQNTSVIWGDRDKCPAEAVCDFIVLDGANVRTINYKGLFIAASFSADGDYAVADVFVKNGKQERMLVDPRIWVALHSKSEAEFTKKAIASEPNYAIDPERVAYKRKFRWSDLFPPVKTATVTTQSSGTLRNGNDRGTYDGTSQSTVTMPDYEARERLARQRQEAADATIAAAMKANTIFSGDSNSGVVYFKRSKKDEFTVFIFGIEHVNYVFYVNWK